MTLKELSTELSELLELRPEAGDFPVTLIIDEEGNCEDLNHVVGIGIGEADFMSEIQMIKDGDDYESSELNCVALASHRAT